MVAARIHGHSVLKEKIRHGSVNRHDNFLVGYVDTDKALHVVQTDFSLHGASIATRRFNEHEERNKRLSKYTFFSKKLLPGPLQTELALLFQQQTLDG